MKEQLKKVFYCDHCNKHGLSKGHMKVHEQWCDSNPENKKACYGCANLKEVEIDAVYFDYNGNDYTRKIKGFFCEKLERNLYPLKVERKGLVEKYPGTFDEQDPMPKQCEHYKNELDNYFN